MLLGSIRQSAVVAIEPDGRAMPLVVDPRLRSVVGIRVDAARGRLLVVNSDYGVAERSAKGEAFTVAALGVYDLATGTPLKYVDLTALRPGERRFLNDLDVDAAGNVYLTDSTATAILKVDVAGTPSVLLTDEQFRGDGFNLNGVQAHPDGFLLVAKKSDGKLFRVPLADPAAFGVVEIAEPLVGTDGLVLTGPRELIAIANRTATAAPNVIRRLVSDDGWRTARVVEESDTGDVYATTGVVVEDRLFVSQGWLHTLPAALSDGAPLRESFRIRAYTAPSEG